MAANSNEGLLLGDDVCGLDVSVKLGSPNTRRKSMWIGRPRFALATGRALTLSSVREAQLPAVRPEIAFCALARCFKCSANSLAIGANNAERTSGLIRTSKKGQIEHCGMRIVEHDLEKATAALKNGLARYRCEMFSQARNAP